MKSEFDQHVQHDTVNGLWVVATWNERAAQYQAPMTIEAQRLTGCSMETARRVENLSGNCYAYKNRRHALARARAIYGDTI